MRTIIAGIATLGLVVMGSISPAAAARNGPMTHGALPGVQQVAWGGCGPNCEHERRAVHERERFSQRHRWEEQRNWHESNRSISPAYRYGERY
jgi:hypothetical protein